MNIIDISAQGQGFEVIVGDRFLEGLRRHAHYARGSMSENTIRAQRTATAIFSGWCAERGLCPLPATVEMVVAFIDHMATRHKPATVAAYCSHNSAMHEAAMMGLADVERVINPWKSREATLAKKRMTRSVTRRQKQATGITSELRDKMLAAAPETLIGLRNRAMLLLAYDGLLRRSELVAIEVSDVAFDEMDGTGSVLLRKSKTDQEGEGLYRIMAADTVRALRAWLQASGIAEGPLFRRVTRWSTVGADGMHSGEVSRLFKSMATAAGLPEEVVGQISGHSARVGCAQDQVAAGMSVPEIMQSGGWKSPVMVGRYTARLDVKRSGAAKLARLQGRV